MCVCECIHAHRAKKETYNFKCYFLSVCEFEVMNTHIHNLSTVSFAKTHALDNKLYFTVDIFNTPAVYISNTLSTRDTIKTIIYISLKPRKNQL